jgi:hypothetical protein
MIIASRTLHIQDHDQVHDVLIEVHQPKLVDGQFWQCHWSIAWPDQTYRQFAESQDSISALFSALKMIGAMLYASEAHRDGALYWLEPGMGYGFPVTNNIRDLLVGHDARYL